MASPIADLSYRNYDGPLDPPALRWWVIARAMMNLNLKRRVLWLFVALSGWYYVGMIFVLFIFDQFAASTPAFPGAPNPAKEFFGRIIWKDQFLHGFSYGQMLFMAILLTIGAGSIANDNRANALLVYLSKPISKLDYVMGKWFGVFLPLLLISSVPALVFYLYGALSYSSYGFISSDPWLLVKVMIALPITAAIQASVIVGVSSLFSQGRLAGAAYAGVYFVSNFFTQLMKGTWFGLSHGGGGVPMAKSAVANLFYASFDGINIGIFKAILGTDGSMPFGIPGNAPAVPRPPLLPMLLIGAAISAVCLVVAWSRVRAVEVVG